jgi:uncharacterized protein (DUF1697 family)
MKAKTTTYVILMRGINVGGQNKIPMGKLKLFLEEQGFETVSTVMQSGNVILQSRLAAAPIARKIEKALPSAFTLDSSVIKVLALSTDQLQAVIDRRPKGFGDHATKYHSDAIFLMGIDSAKAMTAFDPREGVDTVWPGDGVIYSQRLSALRTKTRLNKMMASPLYKSMTIRSWGTTLKLLELVKATDNA